MTNSKELKFIPYMRNGEAITYGTEIGMENWNILHEEANVYFFIFS